MTPKELLFELLKKDGRPDRQLNNFEAFKFVGDPVGAYLRGNRKKGTRYLDRWGVTFDFPEDAPGAMPISTPDVRVLKDITCWRDQVKAPDIASNCVEGWEEARARAEEVSGDAYLSTAMMVTGVFETLHNLMGFEDTLTAFYEHPAEMHELIDYIADYRLEYEKMLVENLHPDAVLAHDDWGTKDTLFMHPDIWREFFKEPYRRLYSYLRENKVIVVHHADSYLAPIVEDMAEIGINVWQGVLPENDIPALQYRLDGNMILMGGIGAAIDREDSSEEEIRSYVRRVLENCCPGGHYIPCVTQGGPASIFPHVFPIIEDEIRRYNSILHISAPRRPEPLHRAANQERASAETETKTAEKKETEVSVLDKLADSLRKGRNRAVLNGVSEALEKGFDPQTIISDGLIRGMMLLGEDFTASRAFVPEMLVAAKCMTSALDVLKPLLKGDSIQKKGKICLGTVKGDMHDIGKNLVKIMLEGGGFEVVDLGVDVPAERFVETAIAESCDIIACSALLTTTMSEMKRVVDLARESGIRDKVKIMVGGAPVTQAFCDEIGADGYADDAAQGVLLAERLINN